MKYEPLTFHDNIYRKRVVIPEMYHSLFLSSLWFEHGPIISNIPHVFQLLYFAMETKTCD